MYQVPRYYIEEGKTTSQAIEELIFNIRNGINAEQSKDDLFKLTYPMALTEAKRFQNVGRPLDELTSDLSIAFMKTLKNYNPEANTVSFMNYYKKAIMSTVIESRYGRFKEDKDFLRAFEAKLGSLDYALICKNGDEEMTLYDTLEDKRMDLERTIENIDLVQDIQYCMDKIFKTGGRGRGEKRNASARKQFETWVLNLVLDSGYSQRQVAESVGCGRSGLNNVIARYMPRLQEELRKIGY